MTVPWSNGPVTLYTGHVLDVLRSLPAESVQCVVTSPPYWGLRDYGLKPVTWDAFLPTTAPPGAAFASSYPSYVPTVSTRPHGSPPFHSLDSGGLHPGCEHEWGETQSPATKLGVGGNTNGQYAGGVFDPGKVYAPTQAPQGGASCLRCGAWHGSLGLEPTPQLYVQHLVAVLREVRRVLRADGVCFLNLGDSYAGVGGINAETQGPKQKSNKGVANVLKNPVPVGLKPKDLVGVPWRVALALQEDGWWLRSDIIWAKPNPMPESVTDRPTRGHEYIFLLAKSERYYWDQEAVREAHHPDGRMATSAPLGEHGKEHYAGADGHERWPNAGRNLRSVWTIPTQPMSLEWCKGCGKTYGKTEYAYLRRGSVVRCQMAIDAEADEKCGSTDWAFEDGVVTCLECGAAYTPAQHKKLPMAKRCNRCQDDQWGSHFATFPEALAERCILAGTSEWGCCPECGAPWERVVERKTMKIARSGRAEASGNRTMPAGTMLEPAEATTIGWRPTCAHADLATMPCQVLDPFSGAGTVALVAQKLGRRAIGIELNHKYNELAVKRLEAVALPMGGGAT